MVRAVQRRRADARHLTCVARHLHGRTRRQDLPPATRPLPAGAAIHRLLPQSAGPQLDPIRPTCDPGRRLNLPERSRIRARAERGLPSPPAGHRDLNGLISSGRPTMHRQRTCDRPASPPSLPVTLQEIIRQGSDHSGHSDPAPAHRIRGYSAAHPPSPHPQSSTPHLHPA